MRILLCPDGQPDRPTLSERVSVEDFSSSHFTQQLIERIGWAAGDALELEEVHQDEALSEAR